MECVDQAMRGPLGFLKIFQKPAQIIQKVSLTETFLRSLPHNAFFLEAFLPKKNSGNLSSRQKCPLVHPWPWRDCELIN